MGSFADGLRSLLPPEEDTSSRSSKISDSIPKRSKRERDSFANFAISGMEHRKTRRKKSEEESLSELFAHIDALPSSASEAYTDLDDAFDSMFSEDQQDKLLMKQLIAQGRAYSRKNNISEEESEIQKAFAPQEDALHKLIDDLDSDMKGVQSDINSLRMARTRNTKTLADLVQAKSSLQNIKLSSIKELNKIRYDSINFRMKQDAAKGEVTAESSNEAYAVRKLLEDANVMGSVGGLSAVSGAIHESDSDYHSAELESAVRLDMDSQRAYDSIGDTEEDSFIRHEKEGVQLFLQYSPNTGNRRVVAKNAMGDIVPDYPVPNIEDLDFSYHDDLGTATDSMSRDYVLEKVDNI